MRYKQLASKVTEKLEDFEEECKKLKATGRESKVLSLAVRLLPHIAKLHPRFTQRSVLSVILSDPIERLGRERCGLLLTS